MAGHQSRLILSGPRFQLTKQQGHHSQPPTQSVSPTPAIKPQSLLAALTTHTTPTHAIHPLSRHHHPPPPPPLPPLPFLIVLFMRQHFRFLHSSSSGTEKYVPSVDSSSVSLASHKKSGTVPLPPFYIIHHFFFFRSFCPPSFPAIPLLLHDDLYVFVLMFCSLPQGWSCERLAQESVDPAAKGQPSKTHNCARPSAAPGAGSFSSFLQLASWVARVPPSLRGYAGAFGQANKAADDR